MTINNRGISGQPTLPYVDYRVYAGEDAFIQLTFVDNIGNLVAPTSAVYQIDDLTNVVNVVPPTNLPITGSPMVLQIPGAILQMTRQWQGSELLQVYITAIFPGGATSKAVAIIELLAIQTTSGI